ncbi:hypothetical protein SAMN04487948_1091 [Halogranum amylolyticum]|uniref:Uncharacterized protein n=1 Tax=Halogranum amylolyticum TaxID=660520 RepID=A0A1H8TY82_9EURY|nr:hypothetical protein [Halogranum amylolyticum]SEO95980.1 hypothetical protein SAMN04487948_1091 [Halogranum amylolyticum]
MNANNHENENKHELEIKPVCTGPNCENIADTHPNDPVDGLCSACELQLCPVCGDKMAGIGQCRQCEKNHIDRTTVTREQSTDGFVTASELREGYDCDKHDDEFQCDLLGDCPV